MKTAATTKALVSLAGTGILLACAEAMAFIPTKTAVKQCVHAVESKYTIATHELGLESARLRLIDTERAVVYLPTAGNAEPAQRRARLYCTVDQHGSVTQLRANPRSLDLLNKR